MIEVPTVAFIAGFVEPITELLVRNRASGRRGIDRSREKVVFGVGRGWESLLIRGSFVDVKLLELL